MEELDLKLRCILKDCWPSKYLEFVLRQPQGHKAQFISWTLKQFKGRLDRGDKRRLRRMLRLLKTPVVQLS